MNLSDKIKQMKLKYGDKKEPTFQDSIDKVKTKYGMMPDAPKALKKDAIPNMAEPQGSLVGNPGAAIGMSAALNKALDDKFLNSTHCLSKSEMDQINSEVDNLSKSKDCDDNYLNSILKRVESGSKLQKADEDSPGYKALRARLKQPNRLKPGNSDEKIRQALANQPNNPYAKAGPGGGRGSGATNFPTSSENKESPKMSAMDRMRERIRNGAKKEESNQEDTPVDDKYRNKAKWEKDNALHYDKDKRSAGSRLISKVRAATRNNKQALSDRKDKVYRKAFGDQMANLRSQHSSTSDKAYLKDHAGYEDQHKGTTERIPGSNTEVRYHGQDEQGNHHFSAGGSRGRDHDFAVSKNAQGKHEINHIPKAVNDYQINNRENYDDKGRSGKGVEANSMPWTDLDTLKTAKDVKRGHASIKGAKAAMTRVKQSKAFANIINKTKQDQPVSHKDFEKVNTGSDGFGQSKSHTLWTRQKHGGSNLFDYKFHPEHNAYSFYDNSDQQASGESPNRAVFEHVIKPSVNYQSKHKDGPEPKLLSHKELESLSKPSLKVVKSDLEKAKVDKDMSISTRRIVRDERRAQHDPLQDQVTAAPGVSKQGMSVRTNHTDSAKDRARSIVDKLKSMKR